MALQFPDGVIHPALDGKQRFDQTHQVQCPALNAPGPPVPRLPSLLLGALIKDRCGCPMVLDVDDFELSFFPDETTAPLDALSAAGAAALHEPYAELATRAADGVVKDADAVIVSNMALRDRFGGIMVRHARDEDDFHPDRFDRAAERAAIVDWFRSAGQGGVDG